MNITENCLDRHVEAHPDKTAIIFEPNDPNQPAEHISYRELHRRVCKFSNVLKNNNIQKGDRVCIYLPMVPELAIAVLACARVGAIHSVVFAGFSSSALSARINDASCKMVLTSDESFRGNKTIDLKSIVDEALKECVCVDLVIILNPINSRITLKSYEKDWNDELDKVDDYFITLAYWFFYLRLIHSIYHIFFNNLIIKGGYPFRSFIWVPATAVILWMWIRFMTML